MKSLNFTIFFSIVLLLPSDYLFSQDRSNQINIHEISETPATGINDKAGYLPLLITGTDELALRKNAIYLNGGLGYGWGGYSLNYERMLYQPKKGFFRNYAIRLAHGRIESFGGRETFSQGIFNLLAGKEKHHFELGVGIAFLTDGGNTVLPAGSIGYRFQQPDGFFVFRTGAGFIDGVYVGVGFVL